MKKIALGLVAATSLLVAAPAMAQVGFYAGPGGVGVGVGVPGPAPYYGYGGCGPYGNAPCYDYYNGPDVVIGGGPVWHGHGYHHWR